ncbi:hypothetical protein L218DRAFT_574401 [Marasmius fiardii PR-910]|nr:hypothetical protein L218DRAFT_574401 [Marasmius fiardii PR-910]
MANLIGASQFTIAGDVNSYIQGNQTINYTTRIIQQKTIYDEFPNIRRGHVYKIRDLDHVDCILGPKIWLNKGVEFEAERTISTAEIHGSSSRFTVVSYKGKDADKAWEKEFRRWSENTDAVKMQLFGINRSSVPLLIFHRGKKVF